MEIFKFEKFVKYANQMTDDVIVSSEHNLTSSIQIELSNFSDNLQQRALKFGSLIVLQATHRPVTTKNLIPMASHSISVPPT